MLCAQDVVYRAIVSKRRAMALSLVANIVLLALLVFKTAPQPIFRRCGTANKQLQLLHARLKRIQQKVTESQGQIILRKLLVPPYLCWYFCNAKAVMLLH
jgi:hypothetical protein